MAIDIAVEERIARPRALVAAYVTDPANEPRWIRGIVESAPVTAGPIAAGARVRRVAKFLGRRVDYTPEVTDYVAGGRLVMKTDAPFPMTIAYEFADAGDGTLFRQRLAGGPTGIAALFSPLMAIIVRRTVRADMRRLRRILESN